MERDVVSCKEARDLLLEVVSGTTPPDARRALWRHLDVCEDCRREAAALEETVVLLRAVPEPHLGDEHWARFMAGLDRRLESARAAPWARTPRWFRHPVHAWTTAAATVALVVVLGLTLSGRPWSRQAAEPEPNPLRGFATQSVVDALPAMDASLAVWKAGFGAPDVSYELTGGD